MNCRLHSWLLIALFLDTTLNVIKRAFIFHVYSTSCTGVGKVFGESNQGSTYIIISLFVIWATGKSKSLENQKSKRTVQDYAANLGTLGRSCRRRRGTEKWVGQVSREQRSKNVKGGDLKLSSAISWAIHSSTLLAAPSPCTVFSKLFSRYDKTLYKLERIKQL